MPSYRQTSVLAVALHLAGACGFGGCGRVGYDPSGVERRDGALLPADALAANTCGVDEIVCGDFDGTFGNWRIRPDPNSQARIRLVDAPARSGSGALAVSSDVNSVGYPAVETRFEPITSGTVYGRVWLWVGTANVVDDYMVVVQLDNGNDDGTEKISIDIMPDASFTLAATTPEPAVRPGSASGVMRTNDWMCLAFEVVLNPHSGSANLDLDGWRLVSTSAIDTVPPTGFSRMLLAAVGPTPGAHDVVFDDVVLARHRVPCPR